MGKNVFWRTGEVDGQVLQLQTSALTFLFSGYHFSQSAAFSGFKLLHGAFNLGKGRHSSSLDLERLIIREIMVSGEI